MLIEEMVGCMKRLALKDGRYGAGPSPEDQLVKAKAWHRALPVDLGPDQFDMFAERIMETGETVTPALIRRMYRESITPKHRQGLDWVATPAQQDPPKPPATAGAVAGRADRKQVGPGSGGVGAHPVGWDLHNMLNGLGIPRHTEHSAVSVPCPKKGCAAGPWSACVDGQGGTRKQPHQARIDAFDEGNAA